MKRETRLKVLEGIIEEWYDNPTGMNSKDLSYFVHDYNTLAKAIDKAYSVDEGRAKDCVLEGIANWQCQPPSIMAQNPILQRTFIAQALSNSDDVLKVEVKDE